MFKLSPAIVLILAASPSSAFGQVATGDELNPVTEVCYTGLESPMVDYVPYFNLNAQKDCEAEGPGPSCGFQYYLDGDVERNNIVSSKIGGPNPLWTAFDEYGKAFGKGGEVAAIYLRFNEPGIVLTPHWHRNTELTFVAKGRAKVTV